MGSIDNEKWNQDFIKEAFEHFEFFLKNVKMVTEKGSEKVISIFFPC